ncbi:MAG: alpha/beta fold hydrolase [Euryarchaeota archaeon]|nr:alpha/beta fold hydrolase [Euryarchaeota archaeon]MDE1836381.1 alpha/beta fold hydrolase [Euryarchaeota archaeon]MDE1881477.1 alpha/beta fold hydrolase [Euryarchaeota archaeon]MDE2046488.1 alpha/beta fold hydrolase [Thermoplasmata archaeon]
MPEAEIRGSKFHYEDVGEGPAVVLLHGLGGDGHEWVYQKAALSSKFRLIIPDLKGHGSSAPPKEPLYPPFEHAKDVVALLDHLQVASAWVVGLSAGGFVALALGLDHSSRVRGLVLIGTTAHVDKYTIAVGRRWMETFQKDGFDAYMDQEMRDIFHPDWLLAHLDEMAKFKESQRGRDLKGIAPSGAANATWDVRPRIGKIKLPTLVVHGMDDRVVDPTSARILRQSILGSEMKLYANTGHMVLLERPQELNELLLGFLGRSGLKAPTALPMPGPSSGAPPLS